MCTLPPLQVLRLPWSRRPGDGFAGSAATDAVTTGRSNFVFPLSSTLDSDQRRLRWTDFPLHTSGIPRLNRANQQTSDIMAMLRRTRGFVEAPVNVLEPTHTSVSLEVLDLHDYGIEELPLPKRDSSSRARSVQPWRIIFLQRNRIAMFDGLAECANLRKLDLSSNCLTQLPNRRFWAFLPNLQVLLLHDNKLDVLNQLLDLVCNPTRAFADFCCDFSSHPCCLCAASMKSGLVAETLRADCVQ